MVFLEDDVSDPVELIVNAPVAAVELEESFWGGLTGCLARDFIDSFTGVEAFSEMRYVTADAKYVLDMGKCEVVIKFLTGPDFADFDTTVPSSATACSSDLTTVISFVIEGTSSCATTAAS